MKRDATAEPQIFVLLDTRKNKNFSSARQLPVPATLYALRFTLLKLWLFTTLIIILPYSVFVNILRRIFTTDNQKTVVVLILCNLFIEISEKMLYI